MTRKRIASVIGAIALGIVGAGSFAVAGSSSAQPSQPPRFAHVILIMFENHGAPMLGDPAATSFRLLAERYARLVHYDAVAHPSLPNYLALVSGSTYGIRSDCTSCVFDGRNLADTLAARSLTWKTYVEHLPHPLTDVQRPAIKARIPFLFFRDVLDSPRRMRDIVALSAFRRDLRTGHLPSFSLVIPDLCHDMHNCSVRAGNRWLGSFMRPLFRSRDLRRSVVFVVFDEAMTGSIGGGGRVPAIVAGPLVRHDSDSTALLSHYSLLRTIEEAWKLPFLGRSAKAAPITGIWR